MAAESRTNECRSLRSVIALLKPYLKDEFSYGPEVEKKKKSKSPTNFFLFFFSKIFLRFGQVIIKSLIFGLKLAIFLVTGRQRVALLQGGKDLEKLNFFYLIRFSIYCKTDEYFCKIRRPYYLSFFLFILCAKFGGHTIHASLHCMVLRYYSVLLPYSFSVCEQAEKLKVLDHAFSDQVRDQKNR